MLVNIRTSIDIVTLACLKMLYYNENDSEAIQTSITEFKGQVTHLLRLPIQVGEKENSRTLEANFLIVNILMEYNVILRRLTLNTIKVLVAPYLLLMHFEMDGGKVCKISGDQNMVRE